MKQTKLNVLAMHERVLSYLNDHVPTWQPFQPMAEQVATLQTSVTNRRTALAGQQVQTQGTTQAKSDAQKAAVDKVLRIAKFASAYALANHDSDFYAQTSRGRGYLLNLPDGQMLAVLTQMLDAITPRVSDLTPYGVTADDLGAARQAIADAQALRNAPRSVLDNRKMAGAGLKDEERTGRQALKVIDNLIHYFDYTASPFVAGYRNARVIVDEGMRHTPPAPPVA